MLFKAHPTSTRYYMCYEQFVAQGYSSYLLTTLVLDLEDDATDFYVNGTMKA